MLNFLGIQIAEFSMHGRHNIDSFLNHTAVIGPKNLTDFTLCLRFNINFLKPIYNALVSYSTFLEDNAINFEVKEDSGQLLLYICKYIKRNQVIHLTAIRFLQQDLGIQSSGQSSYLEVI